MLGFFAAGLHEHCHVAVAPIFPAGCSASRNPKSRCGHDPKVTQKGLHGKRKRTNLSS